MNETSDKWRDRLWPSKALITFCRVITRCRIVGSKNTQETNNGCLLIPHWYYSLIYVVLSFSYSLQFVLGKEKT